MATSGAECDANRHLLLSVQGAEQHEYCDIRARDEQHDSGDDCRA